MMEKCKLPYETFDINYMLELKYSGYIGFIKLVINFTQLSCFWKSHY